MDPSPVELLSSLEQDHYFLQLKHAVVEEKVDFLTGSDQVLRTEVQKLRAVVTEQQRRIADLISQIPLTSFTGFGKLPIELRQHIWHLSIKPRFVTILNFDDPGDWAEDELEWKGLTDATNIVPVTSKICRESRQVFLKEYRLYLSYKKERGNIPIYVNPSIDTVYLPLLSEDDWRHGIRQLNELDDIVPECMREFRQFFDARIETEPIHQRTGLWRKKWEIKNLAISTNALWYFLRIDKPSQCWFHNFSLLQSLPQLEDVTFISALDSPDPYYQAVKSYVVCIPETNDELEMWNHLMANLGWMSSEEDAISQSYPKWSSLKVNFATLRPEWTGALIDRRDGLVLFGPKGYERFWV